jgi:hypothetical protein
MTELQKAHVSGYIRATADKTHPLQTRLSLIITDFEPNSNKQGIPKSEADNIMRYAISSPLKINFDGLDYHGHKNAIPIGPITSAFASNDNGRDVIAGEAVVWNDIYEDVADHLKVAFAEGLGTSWEIYYKDSEKDDNGIEWLQGCVFAGTCVVATPAYGPNRTRVLAIAEKLEEHADESNERLRMANETTTDNVDVDVQQTVADDAVNTLREDISSAMNLLGTIYEGFYSMLDETYELEQNLATNDMGAVAEQFTKLVAGIQKRFESLRDKASTAETELTQLKDRIDAEKSAKEFAEKKTRRLQALSEVGIEPSEDRQAFYLDMSEDIFTAYVDDLKSVRSRFSSSEHKEIIPDPVVSNSTVTITTQELAKIILQK